MAGDALNLRKSVVTDFWKTRDPRMSEILRAMAANEHWHMDSRDRVAQALVGLGQHLEHASHQAMSRRESLEAMIRLMAYLSSPRAMRLLEWINDKHGSLAVELVKTASEMNDTCGDLLIERIQTIRSLALLTVIFSYENIRQVRRTLEKLDIKDRSF